MLPVSRPNRVSRFAFFLQPHACCNDPLHPRRPAESGWICTKEFEGLSQIGDSATLPSHWLFYARHSLRLCFKIAHTSRILRNVTMIGIRRACCSYCTLTENVMDLLTAPLVRVITAFASLPTGVPGFGVPPPPPLPPPQAPITARLVTAIRATTKARRRGRG
jgi:hypothetical protein